jgi:outer membrane receptor protein involved in Fe transport
VPDPKVEKIRTIEGGYLMRTPRYNLRAVGFATDIKDAVEVRRYYSDFSNSFISYVMAGINSRHTGLELSAEVKVTPTLAVTGVAALSQTFYTDNPRFVGLYPDNDSSTTPVIRQGYIKNYYMAVGPQSAYTVGLNYRSKKYWYASSNFNYFDRNYISISPDQRSAEAIAGVPVGSELYQEILGQQALPSVFTIDIAAGSSILLSKYSKSLPRSSFLYINMGISNLLDAEVRTGGFEQLRYDFENVNPGKFGNKYFYGFGRNFFINLSLKF